MSNFKIKLDTKKLEKNINKHIEQIVYNKQKELVMKRKKERRDGSMYVLPNKEEELLEILLQKYDGNEAMQVSGDSDEIPISMHYGLKEHFTTLKLNDYISQFQLTLGGWFVVLNLEGIEYFEKKGMRKELFEELAENEKELLKEIIDIENRDGNVAEFLSSKIALDKKDIVRGVICSLKKNGLISVKWASNNIFFAVLTNSGRTYFEREKKYMERLQQSSNNTYNFGNVAVDGNFVIGDVINSTLNVDSRITEIKNQIKEKASEEDIENLKDLLEEAKEIIENIKNNSIIEKRKGFFRKITEHANKYGWFYAEIVNLIGTAVLGKIGGE